jgi:F-type H+-transporting ATPase subunit a
VAASALATAISGFEPPTASRLSTAALALCVLVAVPLLGIQGQGLLGCLNFCV